jgi:hypothetical protein
MALPAMFLPLKHDISMLLEQNDETVVSCFLHVCSQEYIIL